jgi:hypothetical protein
LPYVEAAVKAINGTDDQKGCGLKARANDVEDWIREYNKDKPRKDKLAGKRDFLLLALRLLKTLGEYHGPH